MLNSPPFSRFCDVKRRRPLFLEVVVLRFQVLVMVGFLHFLPLLRRQVGKLVALLARWGLHVAVMRRRGLIIAVAHRGSF